MGGVMGVVDNTFQRLACFRYIWYGSIEPAQPGFAVRRYGSEGLIDFMGYRRGELSEHRNPRCMREFCLHPLKHPLRANTLCYIDERENGDPKLVDRFRIGERAEHVNYASVQCHNCGFFLERWLSAKSTFQCAPECVWTFPPEASFRPVQLVRIGATQHLNGPVVALLERAGFQGATQEIGVVVPIAAQVDDALRTCLLK